MKHFSLPADFKNETIEQYARLNREYEDSRVITTYGQLTIAGILNSGRVYDVLPEVDYKKLEDYVKTSHKHGIEFDYTLNPACMGNYEFSREGVAKIKQLVTDLYNIGINTLTISIPSLFELVASMGLEVKLKASAICEIMTADKALFYKRHGASKVVVDPDITRDFRKLEQISKGFGEGVEIIINNVCYKNCPYKMYHYNHEAHRNPGNTTGQDVTDYYFNRCSIQKASGFKNVIRMNWIRPEDLKYYQKAGINYFKIQGRQNVVQGDPVRALEAYMKEEYDGDLYELITIFAPYTAFQPHIDNKKLDGFVKTFYEKPDFCRNLCDTCGYCDNYANKSMDPQEAERINTEALTYFKETDKYTQELLKTQPLNQTEEPVIESDELNFDFEVDF